MRDLHYFLIALMLLSGLYVTVTGAVADLFGLHQFALHRYAGYLCAALVLLHLALQWDRVTAYLRWRLGRPRRREAPAPSREAGVRWGRRTFLAAALAGIGGFLLGRWIPLRRPAELPAQPADLGALYHRWSTPGYSGLPGLLADWGPMPPARKTYPAAPEVALPDPRGARGRSWEEILEARRSVRDYTDIPLTLEELSRLLHAAQGVTEPRAGFRAAPSAGALYPIELYVVVHRVAGLEAGVYHYVPQGHYLEQMRLGDFRARMVAAGVGQDLLGTAGVCLVLTAIFQRTRWRYRERAYRYILLEAGHIGQNIYLAATAMGMGACAVGAFLDNAVHELLGVDGEQEAALYILSVGNRAT